MTDSDRYFTVVYKDLSQEDRHNLYFSIPEKVSASSYSHALDDRDQLLGVLSEAYLVLLTDFSVNKDTSRVDSLLVSIRNLLVEHERFSKAETPDSESEAQPSDPFSYMVGEIECHFTEEEVSILASALELFGEKSKVFEALQKKIEDLYEDHCVKYSLSPALEAYHEKYGTWGTENAEEEARWEGFRDAYLALNQGAE